MKRVAIIGSAGVPGRYGGFETLAHNLVDQLNQQYDLTVYCSNKSYPKEERKDRWNGANLKFLPLDSHGFQSIIYDAVSIFDAMRYANTLLILGVPGCFLLPIVRLFSTAQIIVNIDGLEWKREKWNRLAQMFLRASEFMAAKFAHTVIADNKAIQEHAFEAYGISARLIEYGADHASRKQLSRAELTAYPFLRHSYAFKVCRIEPENNIHVVLKAFSELPSKHLVIIGNWNASEYGKDMRSAYGEFPNIHLLDPIYDQVILDRIRSNCYAYVHGHSAGGTNPSLVEAMYLGLPVIAYGVNYNRYTTEDKALYFDNENDLKSLIINTPFVKYVEISEQLQRIARSRYTWRRIAHKYAEAFERVINLQQTPKRKKVLGQQTLSPKRLAHA